MAEKFPGDSDWLIFGHVSIFEPIIVARGILIDLLGGVGRTSLPSQSQRSHCLLQRIILLPEEREEWLLQDKNNGCPMQHFNYSLLIVLPEAL